MLANFADAASLFLNINIYLAIAFGTILGLVFGALPGLTATMGIALLLPLTFGMDPVTGMGMLLGVYCGAISGGSIPAALLNIPGTPSSVATTLDAFPMARNGEPGRALGLCITASMIGGMISVVIFAFMSPLIADVALKFSAIEYFALGLFGLTIIASVSDKSIIKGIVAGLIGVLISLIGIDSLTGVVRLTAGIPELIGGVDFMPALIGLFALSQIISDVTTLSPQSKVEARVRVNNAYPRIRETFGLWKIWSSSSLIGALVGAIPGAGGSIASFLAYDQAKRISKTPEKFRSGHNEGIVSCESANNGMTGGALIPMMTLGIPGDASAAILMGGLLIHGLQPGPMLFEDQANIAYGIIIAFLIANLFMFCFQSIGIKLFVRVLQIPRSYLLPFILVMCILGSYGISGTLSSAWVLLFFGVFGYFLNRYGFSSAPVVLGMILGYMVESNFRRGMTMHEGDWSVFFTRPISLCFILLSVVSIALPIYRQYRLARQKRLPDSQAPGENVP
ncbi:C4-dicarboxylate ABC transporter permease [Zobellella endophytica]|uniref:C4-dicarboxylate ABC transporter permease n=1 Tax=Zobellella endophytica TaxID=2116700 RepID=A0A2P7R0P1_9GAMM|nr:tripartite tricarboxylate transporter permease [Zobellella endophytica]PSJ43778.1 C4-dicarboxylate ABC transporter permease [Zobellella endophytica]